MRLGLAQRICSEKMGSAVNFIIAASESTKRAHRCCPLFEQGMVLNQIVSLS
jgi:hypothetical protein